MKSLGIVDKQFVTLSDYFGRLSYVKIMIDYSDEPYTEGYSWFIDTLDKPCVFYYILLMDIYPALRGKGFGRKLFMRFYNATAPDIVLLDCGIVDEDVYDELVVSGQSIVEWLKENVEPFWSKMGFHNVNYINSNNKETITMIYPLKEAQRLDKIYKHEVM